MKYRPHRHLLSEAMAEVQEVNSFDELMKILSKAWYWEDINRDTVEIKHYGYDERIDWDTYVVTINGRAVGFTNGELK